MTDAKLARVGTSVVSIMLIVLLFATMLLASIDADTLNSVATEKMSSPILSRPVGAQAAIRGTFAFWVIGAAARASSLLSRPRIATALPVTSCARTDEAVEDDEAESVTV